MISVRRHLSRGKAVLRIVEAMKQDDVKVGCAEFLEVLTSECVRVIDVEDGITKSNEDVMAQEEIDMKTVSDATES